MANGIDLDDFAVYTNETLSYLDEISSEEEMGLLFIDWPPEFAAVLLTGMIRLAYKMQMSPRMSAIRIWSYMMRNQDKFHLERKQ